MYRECNVVLDPRIPKNNRVCEFPSKIFLESLSSGCIAVASNISGNFDNIIFDKVTYFKLDFVDANTVVSTLRYIDKRREKLERMSKKGRSVVKKYFNIESLTNSKLEVINRLS